MFQIRKGRHGLQSHPCESGQPALTPACVLAPQHLESRGHRGSLAAEDGHPLLHVTRSGTFWKHREWRGSLLLLGLVNFHVTSGKAGAIVRMHMHYFRISQLRNRGSTSLDRHHLSTSAVLSYLLHFRLSAHSILCLCICSQEQQGDLLEFSSSGGLQKFTGS